MPDQFRVALIVPTATAYARGTLQGVRSYVREHDNWSLFLAEHCLAMTAERVLSGWRPSAEPRLGGGPERR